MEKVKTFVFDCIDYLKANLWLAIVLAVVALCIVISLIVIIALSIKRSKAKKRAKAQPKAKTATPTATATPVKLSPEEEKKKQEEARKAVFERLEQQRLQAEKEEQEQLALEQAKAEKEKPVETPVKKTATKKTTPTTKKTATETKKTTPKKQEEKVALFDELKNAETENKVDNDENETDKTAKYSGKWIVCRVVTDDEQAEETYFFELHASNGEKLFSSEEYTSYNGALRGIETHKANIEKGNFKVTVSKKGDYIFKLLSGKNTLLCMGENYATQARCESAIESTKRFAKTAVLDENIQDHIVKVPIEDDTEITPVNENYNGKWIVFARTGVDGEMLYYFELFANNGEKLLSSEDYTSYIGAINGLQTHKTNIEKGNFRISLTKRGDYIYKLLNGNGQLLCLGEHYKTKRRCQNAVESVKRFATNSPVLTDPSLTK